MEFGTDVTRAGGALWVWQTVTVKEFNGSTGCGFRNGGEALLGAVELYRAGGSEHRAVPPSPVCQEQHSGVTQDPTLAICHNRAHAGAPLLCEQCNNASRPKLKIRIFQIG